MAIYRYTLKKYSKSYSTWIIGLISIIIVFLIGGVLPFKFSTFDNDWFYATLSVSIVSVVTSFISVFTSVFTGFKAASMFRDEVEDGTFLVMLSKPVTRQNIIFYKWLALQTISLIYTFSISLTFLSTVLIFDVGDSLGDLSAYGINTLSSKIVVISLTMWAIVFLVSLIFSSIALMLSTKLSLGTTIGFSVGMGVIIPITTLISSFTSKPGYDVIQDTWNANSRKAFYSSSEKIIDELQTQPQISSLLFQDFFNELGIVNKLTTTDNKNTLWGLGLQNNNTDAFNVGQYFDLNYQIQKLSEFASEHAVSAQTRNNAKFDNAAKSLRVVTNDVIDGNPFPIEIASEINTFNNLLYSSWIETIGFRVATTKLLLHLIQIGHITDDIFIESPFYDGNFSTLVKKDANGRVINALLNDQNKDVFIKELYAPDGLISWISKTKDEIDAFTHDESVKYSIAVTAIRSIMTRITKFETVIIFDNIAKSIPQFDMYFQQFRSAGKDIYNPLEFWIDYDNFDSFASEYYVSNAKEYLVDVKKIGTNLVDNALTTSLGNLKETVRLTEVDFYNSALETMELGYHIAKIQTVEYASKWTILWIYLSIALVLVPLSYFVVRKQDFR